MGSWNTYSSAQGLLLPLCSGVSPRGAQGPYFVPWIKLGLVGTWSPVVWSQIIILKSFFALGQEKDLISAACLMVYRHFPKDEMVISRTYNNMVIWLLTFLECLNCFCVILPLWSFK